MNAMTGLAAGRRPGPDAMKPMNRPLSVLVVDDEPLARERLERALADMADIAYFVGSAESCRTALWQIMECRPDVVLLDVDIGDGLSFELLDTLPSGRVPAVIFVTAFANYAARAFDISAVDYVLKPVAFDRLRLALERARDLILNVDARGRLAEMSLVIDQLRGSGVQPPNADDGDFWIRKPTGSVVRVSAASIDWATVEEDYVRLHAKDSSYLLRDSMRGLMRRLDTEAFGQIFKSTVVRYSAISEVTRGIDGTPEVVLSGGQRLKVGRVYLRALREKLLPAQ